MAVTDGQGTTTINLSITSRIDPPRWRRSACSPSAQSRPGWACCSGRAHLPGEPNGRALLSRAARAVLRSGRRDLHNQLTNDRRNWLSLKCGDWPGQEGRSDQPLTKRHQSAARSA